MAVVVFADRAVAALAFGDRAAAGLEVPRGSQSWGPEGGEP
jgi:hypothetical protein